MAGGDDTGVGAFAAFRHRNFAMFWIAAVISNTGRWFQALAIPLIVLDLTSSAGWVGLAGFAQLLPMALLGPLAGAIADRYSRRHILLITQSLQALTSVLFVVMWQSGVRSPGAYVIASVAAGAAAGLNLPAWQAFVSELVPRDTLMSAITLNSAQFNTARLLGPTLAGVLIASGGPGWAFSLNAISYGAVIVALLAMRLPRSRVTPTGRMRPMREFVQTLGYVRTKPGIITAISTVTLIGFFGLATQQMVVVMAEDVFDLGETGFGAMVSAVGLGAIATAPVVAHLSRRVPRSQIMEIALILYGCGITLMAVAPEFWMALVGMVVIGAAHISSASTLNTAIQLQVDEKVRAKVLSVYLTVLLLSNPLGQLTQGQAIEVFGPRQTFFVSGSVLIVLSVILRASGRLAGLDAEVGTYEPAAAAEAHPSTPAPPP